MLAAVAGQAYALLRSLVPNVLYEQPQKFKIGLPTQFPEGVTFIKDRRVYVFRNQNTFHVLSAKCTHLGCTVKMVNLNQPETVEIKGRQVEMARSFTARAMAPNTTVMAPTMQVRHQSHSPVTRSRSLRTTGNWWSTWERRSAAMPG